MIHLNKEMLTMFKYMSRLERKEIATWLLSNDSGHLDFPEDLDRMQGVLYEEGISISYDDLQILWRKYSNSVDQDWVTLPKYDATLLTTLQVQGDIHGWNR